LEIIDTKYLEPLHTERFEQCDRGIKSSKESRRVFLNFLGGSSDNNAVMMRDGVKEKVSKKALNGSSNNGIEIIHLLALQE
jgi:hypothetical protein